MQRYLICSDIDGTLMTSDQKITERTMDTIQLLQDEGHIFYLATGRMLLSAQQIAQSISQQTGVIASNGGILSFKDECIKYTLNRECSIEIYQIATKYQLPLFFFSHDTVYYNLVLPDYFKDDDAQGRIDSGYQKLYYHIQDEKDLREHSKDFINAIIISEDHPEELKIAKELLEQNQDLTVTSSFWNNIELSPKGISKAIAIEKLQEIYQISPTHTIAFGDGDNDIEMFKVSKISVAMSNASDTLKAISTHQTLSHNEEGVYNFLNEFFKLGGNK